MAKFNVQFVVDVEIEIAEEVLEQAATDDTIRKGGLDRRKAAEHIAYNFTRNHLSLSMIDGFANFDNAQAKSIDESWDCDSVNEAK